MFRLAVRHPFVASIVILVAGTSVGLFYAWARNDVEWRWNYSTKLAEDAQAQSVINAVFPPKTPQARFQAEPAPNFTLTDEDGKLVSLAAFGGKTVLLNFMFTSCKEACSQTTRELKGLQEQFAPRMGKDMFFLSVTVDPKHDTPQVLKAYGEKNGVDFRSWRFLTGTEKQVADVRKRFGVVAEEVKDPDGQPDIMHTASTFVVDGQGWVRAKLQPGGLTLFGQSVVKRVLAMAHG